MRDARPLRILARGTNIVLVGCFAVLCMRYVFAAFHETAAFPWPMLILTASGLGLGCWRPSAGLFAFTILIPLLSGVVQTGLLGVTSPLSLLFSAIWLGITTRRFFNYEALHESSGIEAFTKLLIVIVLLSLAVQIAAHFKAPDFSVQFASRTELGYGEPYYFLTSAFLWLQGLFFFKEAMAIELARKPAKAASNACDWIKPVCVVYGLTMGIFFVIECFLHIPEGWVGIGFQSPFEDISSLGGIAVTLMVFSVASIRKATTFSFSCELALLFVTVVLMIASWSRGTWLAGICFLLLVAWCRLPTRWFALYIAVGVCAVVGISYSANAAVWQRNSYLARLVQLVRIEDISSKSSGRLELWHKATGMISEHPIIGHGIGSFYQSSTRYARPDDPNANTPNFAHNTFLQITAEQGIPAFMLFAGLCGWTLWQGFRMWLQDTNRRFSPSERSSTTLGVTLALAAYLQTQMTANSLNIYASNQFFFWFLMAMLVTQSSAQPEKVT